MEGINFVAVEDPAFLGMVGGERQPLSRGADMCLAIPPSENCMKMKNFGQEGAGVPSAPLEPHLKRVKGIGKIHRM